MSFPEKVYTTKEVEKAKNLIAKGYKHELTVEGNPSFKEKVFQALELIKTAGYYDFFRTYIRSIKQIDGITQLREAEVAIWTTEFVVDSFVDAASLFMQKAYQMKEFLEGDVYYGKAELRSIDKRIEFLEILKTKTSDQKVKQECQRLLDMWEDTRTTMA